MYIHDFFINNSVYCIFLCSTVQVLNVVIICFQSDLETNQLSSTLPSDFKLSRKTDISGRKIQRTESFAFFAGQDETSNLLKMRAHPKLGSSEPNLRTLSVCRKYYCIKSLELLLKYLL